MYQYSDTDQTLLDERVNQFRDQTNRFLKGEIADDEFRALRLMNGLYVQTPRANVTCSHSLRTTLFKANT